MVILVTYLLGTMSSLKSTQHHSSIFKTSFLKQKLFDVLLFIVMIPITIAFFFFFFFQLSLVFLIFFFCFFFFFFFSSFSFFFFSFFFFSVFFFVIYIYKCKCFPVSPCISFLAFHLLHIICKHEHRYKAFSLMWKILVLNQRKLL